VPGISGDRNDLAGIDCFSGIGLENLERTIQQIKYLRIGLAMKWNHASCGHRFVHRAYPIVD
jgi:hypothetical protein